MSCKEENQKRKTYENSVRLAKICKEMSNFKYVIYMVEENVFDFCREEEYNPTKGVKIIDV